jgi:hypothetical protein
MNKMGMYEMKIYDVKWVKGQLGRSIVAENEQEVKEYMNKKYPKREILSIKIREKIE